MLAEVTARLLTGKMPAGFHFAMDTYLSTNVQTDYSCNTAGCIAGLTVTMAYPGDKKYFSLGLAREAARLLGLHDLHEARDLFTPHRVGDYAEITEVQAGRVLAHYIRTGEINWTVRDKPITVAGRKF